MSACLPLSSILCCPTAVDCLVEKVLVDNSDLSEETKEYVSLISDALTQVVITAGPKGVMFSNETPKTNRDVRTEDVNLGWAKSGSEWNDWKQKKVKQIKHTITDNWSTVIVGEDDFFSKYSCIEKLTGVAMRNRFLLPLEDSLHYFESNKVASRVMTDLKCNEGQAQPTSYNTDFNMLTDESFSRIFFQGIGCPLIAKQEQVSDSWFGPHVVDMPIQHLPARKLFKPYGARIHFDANQKVTAIYDYVEKAIFKPGQQGWEDAKMHAKVTAFTLLTAREHLVWSHLTVSNDTSRESTIHLPPSHPIRRLLTVFTYRATEVNLEAFDTLVPRTSLLHRSCALTWPGMKSLFDMAYTGCSAYKPFPERKVTSAVQKMVDSGTFAYVSEGNEYYEIVRSFVRDWLSKAGNEVTDSFATNFYYAMKEASKGQAYTLPSMDEPDAMVNLLSTIIFTVTGYHEIMGHVVDYTILPTRAGFRIGKKSVGGIQTQIDLQSFLNATMISASTSKRMPKLIAEFPNYIGAGGAPEWEKDVWGTYQTALKRQSAKVQAADQKRSVEFKYFDPSRFECSISV